ncbi:MAG: arylesterase [Rhodopseudomonas sp.]|nr:arylesterase [Rhodopseudomonas sp.]
MLPPYGTSSAVVEGLTRTIAWLLVAGVTAMAAAPAVADSAAAAPTRPIKLVVLGDSLSAGYGLPAAAAFPVRLQKALKSNGRETEIINAGVSGDTASGGLGRLDWSVPADTEAVILELGANDALRGTDPKVTRAALDEILKRLKSRNIKVLLCGMLAPPNYGADYAAQFNAIYPDLAKTYAVPLYPFFLDGVATIANLNQADGLHPTAEGVDTVVNNILPTVEAFLGTVAGQRS